MEERKEFAHTKEQSLLLKPVAQLTTHFIALVKAVGLYPKGHQILLQIIEKFYAGLGQFLEQHNSLQVKIFNNKLFVHGLALDSENVTAIDEFVEQLQKRYVRQILFLRGTSLNDIAVLVEILHDDPAAIAENGGAAAMLSAAGTSAVKITGYYYRLRRQISVNQEALINLTNHKLFNFFIDTSTTSLDPEMAGYFYEVIKDPALVREAAKVAAHHLTREGKSALPPSTIMLDIFSRIKKAAVSLGVSEEEELNHILQDILQSFSREELFEIAFGDPENALLTETGAVSRLTEELDNDRITQLIIARLTAKDTTPSTLLHVKQVLKRLFINRAQFLNFLPGFKDKLQAAVPREDKAKKILNEVCSAFGPGLAMEDDVELALGTISEAESGDIVHGLNILKSVQIDRTQTEQAIAGFDVEGTYRHILFALFGAEQDSAVFQRFLERLLGNLKDFLEQGDITRGLEILAFFGKQIRIDSALKQAHKMMLLINIPARVSPRLVERVLLKAFAGSVPEEIRRILNVLQQLIKEQLAAVLMNIYLHQTDASAQPVILEFLEKYQSLDVLKAGIDLRKESSAGVLRFMELIRRMNPADALPALWEITFHEDLMLAQRALQIIDGTKTQRGLSFLLEGAEHPKTQIRLLSMEYLAGYNQSTAINKLCAVARQDDVSDGNREFQIELRFRALSSLMKAAPDEAERIIGEILKKKRFMFFPREPRELRRRVRQLMPAVRK